MTKSNLPVSVKCGGKDGLSFCKDCERLDTSSSVIPFSFIHCEPDDGYCYGFTGDYAPKSTTVN
jgi:hypothetical protein